MKTISTFSTRKGLVYSAIAFLLMACGPDFERLDFNGEVQDDLGGKLSIQRLTGHEGMIVKSHVTPWDDDNEQMKLNVSSNDPNTVEVANIITPNDFAFICKRQGTTTLEFRADDELVLRVEAVCLAQPDPATIPIPSSSSSNASSDRLFDGSQP